LVDSPAPFGDNRRVDLWRVSFSPKTGCHTHRVPSGFGHPLLVPVVASYFAKLRVAASVSDGRFWWRIHDEPDVTPFELEHGRDKDRSGYNATQLTEVRRQKRTIRAEHAGYTDLFVPILARGRAQGVLVTGPFATARPTGTDVLERWRWLTGRQGHPSDPEFGAYLSAALRTLVLDEGQVQRFERLLFCLARLLAGEGKAHELANEADALYVLLRQARAVDETWDSVRAMLDDRFPQTWSSNSRVSDLFNLGLSRTPDHLMVGLTVGRTPEPDPVDEAIRRDAFQRGAVDLARVAGEAVAGQVGDHGVVFLSSATGPSREKKQRSLDFSERASALGQRFGLSLHFGVNVACGSAPLARSYEAALAAAESALVQGTKIVFVESGADRPRPSLSHLRRELSRAVREHPEVLGARFDRYLEAVAVQCGYRIEPARAHLEVGFERMAEPLVDAGALDERSFLALRGALDRAALDARTASELFAAYRRASLDLSEAVKKPVSARRDRSLRAAVEYIGQHYGEPLRLETVARVAGFTPSHFSKLFILREHRPFIEYLGALRLTRAKQLLSSTELGATRVAELTGYNSLGYFCRVFRRALGVTPLEYRQAAHAAPLAKKRRSTSTNS
jgi:AraC-like DNA-binding protein